MARAERVEATGGGPWSRFACAFGARRSSRWAWRALLLCVGLAVFAPLIANDRPYFARFRDLRRYEEARALIEPIAEDVARASLRSQGESWMDSGALREWLDQIDAALASEGNSQAREAVSDVRAALLRLELAEEARESPGREAAAREMSRIAESSAATLKLGTDGLTHLAVRTTWPLFSSLSVLDIAAMCAWVGVATLALWSRLFARASLRSRIAGLFVLALAVGALGQCVPHSSNTIDAGAWKSRVAADPEAATLFAPVGFGPNETDLSRALEEPFAAGQGRQVHVCGSDALGRDLLARLLYAGRTSFRVASLAALLILLIGCALGLAAGALRGLADMLVSRAIELLQSFPTLVLLLGLVSLLPARAANSLWTIPLIIAFIGWTHIARLARAEAMRVNEMAFVRAATAAGFSRSRVLLRHVLPNSMGPVWVAASFVLSAGLVLESSAAFLGFGIQHPAPSWGGLLAEARGGDAWWLALFPGLWLFAAILSIHLVGEGVRDALDPREEAKLP